MQHINPRVRDFWLMFGDLKPDGIKIFEGKGRSEQPGHGSDLVLCGLVQSQTASLFYPVHIILSKGDHRATLNAAKDIFTKAVSGQILRILRK